MTNALYGTGTYIRLIVRRDRLWLACLVAVAILHVVLMTFTILSEYPTQADLEEIVQVARANPVQIVLRGQVFGMDHGSVLSWSVMTAGALLLGIAGLMLVLRHTRTEEATGRAEFIGGQPLGQHAPLAAILIVVCAVNALIAFLLSIVLPAIGFPTGGSIMFGLAYAANGIMIAAFAALLAQATETAKAAVSLGVAAIVVFLMLRAIGNLLGPEAIGWLSPFGWTERIVPFAGNNLLWLLPPVAFTFVTLSVAFAIRTDRDLGRGLLPQKIGPAAGSKSLGGPLALAWRQHRGVILAWSLGLFAFGFIMTPAISDAEAQLPEAMVTFFIAQGGDVDTDNLTDIFLNYLLTVASFIVGAVTIGIASKLRADEAAGSTELLLSTSVSRRRLALSHLAFIVIGPAAILLSLGLSVGLTYGAITTGLFDQLGRVLLVSAVNIPASWVMGAITLVLIGFFPRWTVAAWAVWIVFLMIDLFNQLHPALEALLVIVPFLQPPWTLAGSTAFSPVFALMLVSAVLTTIAVSGFERRDLGG